MEAAHAAWVEVSEPWRAAARERALFVRYRLHGDMRAREELVERHLGLATALARRYRHDPRLDEDLAQVASLALVKAVDRFELARGNRLSSLAVPMILGELKRYLRDNDWGVHVARGLQERSLTVQKASGRLTAELGRAPSPRELGFRLELPLEEVIEALEAASARRPDRLDGPAGAEGSASIEGRAADDPWFSRVELRSDIRQALVVLPPRERELLRLRFFEELTQTQIAGRLGISQMHVSRLLRHALERLHAEISEA